MPNNETNLPLSNPQSLRFALQVLKDNVFLNLNVCMPCVVKSYNATDNTVDVQPSIQSVLTDGSFMNLAQIYSVPVITLGGKGLAIRFPIVAGDTGLLIVSDRDIALFMQEYKKNGFETTQPQTTRKHNIADSFFLPSTFGKVETANTNGISVQNTDKSIQFIITDSGITVKGNITVDGGITTTGDVVADGISLKNHTHKYVKAVSADNLVTAEIETEAPTA